MTTMTLDAPATRRRNLAVLVALAALSLACQRDLPPAPAPVVPAAAPTPPKPAVVAAPGPSASAGESDTAARWIASLRKRDVAALTKLAGTPFDFRDTRPSPPKGCQSRAATDRRGVAAVVKCLARDKLLHADLLANPAAKLFASAKETLPAWAEPWADTLRPGLRPMSIFIHFETSAFEIILLVSDENVRGVWQNVILEPK